MIYKIPMDWNRINSLTKDENCVRNFITPRIDKPLMFEYYETNEDRIREFGLNGDTTTLDWARLTTVDIRKCYQGAVFKGCEFNEKEITINIEADDRFNPYGEFFPFSIRNHLNRSTKIIRLDYVLTGGIFMDYIIELKMTDENLSKEGYVDKVKKFLDERINKYDTFEVFSSLDKREYDIRTCQRVSFGDRDNIKLNGATRYCSTLKKNCYPNATITRYDFDDVSKTYFIEIKVPETFDPNGYFVVRDFSQMNKANPYNKSDNVQIVGLDYILRKGEPEDENQSRTQDKS